MKMVVVEIQRRLDLEHNHVVVAEVVVEADY